MLYGIVLYVLKQSSHHSGQILSITYLLVVDMASQNCVMY